LFVIELILIILVTLIATSIIWSTVKAGISPMPSSKKARQAVMQLVETVDDDACGGDIVDLGSGWGGLVIRLAQTYPDRKVVGYELSPIPWFTSLCIAKCLRLENLKVYRRDFLKADLSAASVMVCYLFPEGMVALEKKLTELPAARRYLISNNFALPSHKPQETIQLDDFYRSPVYLYRVG
jgi:predicted RNA methylase